jgi:fermentation-respiration switch protein FrsA (DUF1100 family)/uncharacterized membrane protein
MILRGIHLLLMSLYVALPAIALAAAVLRRYRVGRWDWLIGLGITVLAGATSGVSVALIYSWLADGQLGAVQGALSAYLGVGLVLILKILDLLLIAIINRVVYRRRDDGPRVRTVPRVFIASAVRMLVLSAVGLPYVMAAVLTYRPRLSPAGAADRSPGPYERVVFEATDGTQLVGWWVPATPAVRRERRGRDRGRDTVIACHGMASDKSGALDLIGRLPSLGYNVLVFDLRAHGESRGQLTSYGDLERRDVLGAVRWVHAAHPQQSRKVFGFGIDIGAAALIAAAADDSAEGQAIQALAVYGAYDKLQSLAGTVGQNQFTPLLRWLLVNISLPMACGQTGTDLTAFSPADALERLWPRPLLVIHNQADPIIAYGHGQELFRLATHPKYFLGLEHSGPVDDEQREAMSRLLAEFFRLAKPVPVI